MPRMSVRDGAQQRAYFAHPSSTTKTLEIENMPITTSLRAEASPQFSQGPGLLELGRAEAT
jgi:hypothetical protein